MHGVRERVHVPPAPLAIITRRTRVVESGFDYSHINMFAFHRFRLSQDKATGETAQFGQYTTKVSNDRY